MSHGDRHAIGSASQCPTAAEQANLPASRACPGDLSQRRSIPASAKEHAVSGPADPSIDEAFIEVHEQLRSLADLLMR
ncbi:MAG: hypothetical protein ACO4BU_10795, partial [Phycisphaerales bacterium]